MTEFTAKRYEQFANPVDVDKGPLDRFLPLVRFCEKLHVGNRRRLGWENFEWKS